MAATKKAYCFVSLLIFYTCFIIVQMSFAIIICILGGVMFILSSIPKDLVHGNVTVSMFSIQIQELRAFPFDSNISLFKINLVDPGSTAVNVYVSSDLPNKASQFLVPIKTQVLQGIPHQKYSIYPYNYLGVFSDQPIYLLQNSVLKYTLDINTNNSTDDCPVRLCLFNDTNMYYYFLYHYTSVDVMCTPCIMESTRKSLNVNESSLYFVAIQIAANVIVNSTISVDKVYYNTTGLSRPNGCNHVLTSVNPSDCEVTVCGDKYFCTSNGYILVVPNGTVIVDMTSNARFLLNGNIRIAFFAISIFLCILNIIILIATCLIMRRNIAGNGNLSINQDEKSNQVHVNLV